MATKVPGQVTGTTSVEDEQELDGVAETLVKWEIPNRINALSISVALPAETGNVYRVEYTNSITSRVKAGTEKWFDAFGADQSVSRIVEVYGDLSAVRVTRVSGTGTFLATIRGH